MDMLPKKLLIFSVASAILVFASSPNILAAVESVSETKNGENPENAVNPKTFATQYYTEHYTPARSDALIHSTNLRIRLIRNGKFDFFLQAGNEANHKIYSSDETLSYGPSFGYIGFGGNFALSKNLVFRSEIRMKGAYSKTENFDALESRSLVYFYSYSSVDSFEFQPYVETVYSSAYSGILASTAFYRAHYVFLKAEPLKVSVFAEPKISVNLIGGESESDNPKIVGNTGLRFNFYSGSQFIANLFPYYTWKITPNSTSGPAAMLAIGGNL